VRVKLGAALARAIMTPMRARGVVVVVGLVVGAGCNAITGAADVAFQEPESVPAEEDAGTTELPPLRDAGQTSPEDATGPVDASVADVAAEAGYTGPLRAFVTSMTWTGNLGGIAGADQKCKDAAIAGNLGGSGNWAAWISTNGAAAVSAIDRLTSAGPWQMVDGTVIATDKADLTDGLLAAALRRDELNTVVGAGNDRTWTGTRPDGTPAQNDCAKWTAGNGQNGGAVGEANQANGNWSNLGPETCNNDNRLYCFELR